MRQFYHASTVADVHAEYESQGNDPTVHIQVPWPQVQQRVGRVSRPFVRVVARGPETVSGCSAVGYATQHNGERVGCGGLRSTA